MGDMNALRQRIEGSVTTVDDGGYEGVRQALTWNRLVPRRYPGIIVQVASEKDVVEAVRFARAGGLKIAVRGGGHSWIGFSLRDDGLLIDLSKLKRLSVDAHARQATVQPGVTGRILNRELAAYGLAFPVGHCPTVALSGYLLNGGFGWNSNAWGPACFSVEAVRVVTAEGEVVDANEARHADLFWAARGGGPGFPGVVTQYTVNLFEAPHDIRTSTYYYPFEEVVAVGGWLGRVSGTLPKEVEVNLHIVTPDRFDSTESNRALACVVTSTAFVDSEAEARALLGFMEDCPADRLCYKRTLNESTPVETLARQGERVYPADHRYRVNTLWTDDASGPMLEVARELFLRAPSSKSFALYGFSTGLQRNVSPMPDVAFSMAAEALLLHYAIWEHPADDEANIAWHRDMTDALRPYAVGHYIGESDIEMEPSRAARCFAPESWQRLREVRRSRDPGGLFHGHFET